jgi:hypothetical protein
MWRMGWDSNPRRACTLAGFQDRCLKPLGHPSESALSLVSLEPHVGRVIADCIAASRQAAAARSPLARLDKIRDAGPEIYRKIRNNSQSDRLGELYHGRAIGRYIGKNHWLIRSAVANFDSEKTLTIRPWRSFRFSRQFLSRGAHFALASGHPTGRFQRGIALFPPTGNFAHRGVAILVETGRVAFLAAVPS